MYTVYNVLASSLEPVAAAVIDSRNAAQALLVRRPWGRRRLSWSRVPSWRAHHLDNHDHSHDHNNYHDHSHDHSHDHDHTHGAREAPRSKAQSSKLETQSFGKPLHKEMELVKPQTHNLARIARGSQNNKASNPKLETQQLHKVLIL